MGAAAKIFASTLTYPYQVIKSRLQQRDPIVSLTNNGNSNMNMLELKQIFSPPLPLLQIYMQAKK